MVFIPNSSVRVLDPLGDAMPGYDYCVVQIVPSPVSEDPGMVEIVRGGSSAMAPLETAMLLAYPDQMITPEMPLTTGLYSDPIWGPRSPQFGSVDPTQNYTGPQTGYIRGGLVYILEQFGQGGMPLIAPGPWHILRARRPAGLMPMINVRMARIDFLVQTVTWYQHITINMPGAFRTAAWQPDLQQLLATDDGSFGVGVGAVVNGKQYLGYLPGVKVQLGVNEYAAELNSEELGLLNYEHPVIIYERPLAFTKFDILVLADGRRLMVSDLTHFFQRLGITLAILQMCEIWEINSAIYDVNP